MISLGQASNYTFGQVLRHLFAWGTQRDSNQLRAGLAARYHVAPDHVVLYHTGRSALTAAIAAAAKHQPCHVIIPGLTCIAVVRAVRAAGCEPIFVDIEPDTLAYNYTQLADKLRSLRDQDSANSRPLKQSVSADTTDASHPLDKKDKVCYNGSIILVQNTLGIPWDIAKIQSIAKQYNALIVEDLAHSAGRKYQNGREVGTIGISAALSFGKGKAIDTISGGAAIVRTEAPAQPARLPKLSDRLRDRWYPLFGLICRATWRVGLGKAFMCLLVKNHWVQRSADAELNLNHRLTHWQARLALRQLEYLPTGRLRDYRLVEQRTSVLTELRQKGYNFEEIWYDAPVSPRRYAAEADFPAQACPATVQISRQIINLPTWYKPDKLATAYEIIKHYEVKL